MLPHKVASQGLTPRRKYREGHWEALEEALRLEKLRSGAGGAVYCLGAKLDTPGVFYLGYIVSRTPHREYFTVTNTGFYFRHEVRELHQGYGGPRIRKATSNDKGIAAQPSATSYLCGRLSPV